METVRLLEGEHSVTRKRKIIELIEHDRYPYFTQYYDFETAQLGRNTGENIIVPSGRQLEIGISSHFDVVENCPGADDNASSVAVALDVLRRLRRQPTKHVGVRYFFFDQEERGLAGSYAYANQIGKGNLVCLYNMECVGLGDNLSLWEILDVGKYCQVLIDEAQRLDLDCELLPTMMENKADHYPFSKFLRENAFTLTMVNDQDIENYRNFLEFAKTTKKFDELTHFWEKTIYGNSVKYSHYHQPTDVSGNLSADSLHAVSDLLFNTVKAIDSGNYR